MEDIENAIKTCRFDLLRKTVVEENGLSKILRASDIFSLSKDSILGYYTCIYLLSLALPDAENAVIHHAASTILSFGLNYINDAYALGFYHMRQAMELDPHNLAYKREALLIYGDIPDFDMDIEVKAKIVKDILNISPQDDIALQFAT